ncbi:MAG: hypothetical protein Q4A07_06805, partial [Coriobacteriales bacterium]|nr:hypothetical protein [Coriobacteriales bacterium]
MSRYLGVNIQLMTREYARISAPFIDSMIKNCSEEGGRAILDQTMLDGSIVQQISTNDSDPDSVDLLPTDVHSRRQVLTPPPSMRGRWGVGAGGASSSAQPPLL